LKTGHSLQGPNPFAIAEVVAGYEAWYETTGRRADRLEKALLRRLVGSFPCAQTILEVGCGTGHFTRWLATHRRVASGREKRLHTVGLDLSQPMLAEAVSRGDPPCVQGDALALPFPARAFDLIALITTLEFLTDPRQALIEALRVARQGLILGVLNRQSRLGRQLRGKGGPVWEAARFFTPAELVQLVKDSAPRRPMRIRWRTTLSFWPWPWQLPWGGFIGLLAQLL
jgi:ubiquinone/menaquinone biosynthesis C-methylase UbiE